MSWFMHACMHACMCLGIFAGSYMCRHDREWGGARVGDLLERHRRDLDWSAPATSHKPILKPSAFQCTILAPTIHAIHTHEAIHTDDAMHTHVGHRQTDMMPKAVTHSTCQPPMT